METFKEGVITIVKNGKLVGIIYNDAELKMPIVYNCTEAVAEDIATMISGSTSHNGRSAKSKTKNIETIE